MPAASISWAHRSSMRARVACMCSSIVPLRRIDSFRYFLASASHRAWSLPIACSEPASMALSILNVLRRRSLMLHVIRRLCRRRFQCSLWSFGCSGSVLGSLRRLAPSMGGTNECPHRSHFSTLTRGATALQCAYEHVPSSEHCIAGGIAIPRLITPLHTVPPITLVQRTAVSSGLVVGSIFTGALSFAYPCAGAATVSSRDAPFIGVVSFPHTGHFVCRQCSTHFAQ